MPHPSKTARCAIACILVAAVGQPARAEPIVPDRPDFAESSTVVGAGRFQIETGLNVERDREAGTRTRSTTTPTLLRLGLDPAWELRIETDGYARVDDGGTRSRGWNDASVGLKWHVQDGGGAAPSLAWLLHADLPTGSAAFRGHGTRPSLRLSAEWELSEDWSLAAMPGVLFDRTDGGRRYVAGIAALSLGRDWGERLHTYVELAGQHLASARNGGSQVTWDAGATWRLSDDLQVDLGGSWAANHRTPDFAWGVGLALRF